MGGRDELYKYLPTLYAVLSIVSLSEFCAVLQTSSFYCKLCPAKSTRNNPGSSLPLQCSVVSSW